MRPFLERLPWQEGSSLAVLDRRLEEAIPFQWHHHPEYELTLTLNSRGQRFIGDHVSEYDDCDLVLVGPNLPHTWVSREAVSAGPHVALVIWFHPDWAARVVADFVEFGGIGALLARAGCGLAFSPDVAAGLRADFEAFFRAGGAERLLVLMRMLDRLAGDGGAVPLASAAVHQDGVHESRERIDRVLRYIHANYAEGVSMEALAHEAALSASGLHRLFRKHTQGTVSAYVMALRIGEACARLSGTDQPVGFISDAVGYRAAANFNRQFRALKGMTPRQYRAHFRGAMLDN